MINIITYEQRVAKMKKTGDEDIQLKLAMQYVNRLIAKSKKADTLEEKLDLKEAVKKAECVLRNLRLNVFDLEDMLEAKTNCATNTHKDNKTGELIKENQRKGEDAVYCFPNGDLASRNDNEVTRL